MFRWPTPDSVVGHEMSNNWSFCIQQNMDPFLLAVSHNASKVNAFLTKTGILTKAAFLDTGSFSKNAGISNNMSEITNATS